MTSWGRFGLIILGGIFLASAGHMYSKDSITEDKQGAWAVAIMGIIILLIAVFGS